MYFVKCIIKLEGVLYMIDCSVKKTSIMLNNVLMSRNIVDIYLSWPIAKGKLGVRLVTNKYVCVCVCCHYAIFIQNFLLEEGFEPSCDVPPSSFLDPKKVQLCQRAEVVGTSCRSQLPALKGVRGVC
jgi:hypothetical protein